MLDTSRGKLSMFMEWGKGSEKVQAKMLLNDIWQIGKFVLLDNIS